jgi:hypothetical protein
MRTSGTAAKILYLAESGAILPPAAGWFRRVEGFVREFFEMECRMLKFRNRARTPRVLVLVLAVVGALSLAGAASAEFPTKRSDPSLRGTLQEGQTLQGSTGQWLDAQGLPCTDCTFRYTWQRCNVDASGCADIPGGTGLSYTLVAADVGRRIRIVEWIKKVDCDAHGKNCLEIEKNGVSSPSAPIAPKAIATPQATAVPTIVGLAMEDEVLSARGGTWTGPGTITKTIFWQRCNTAGEGCATMSGTPGSPYRLTTADIGSRLRVIEVATNEGGSSQAVSATTDVVVELKPSAARPTIAITKVTLPHRLILGGVTTKQRGNKVTLKVKISDDRGFRIVGAMVSATPIGIVAGSGSERATDRTGWATFTFTATGSGRAWVYFEARRKGEKQQSGIWTAKLFSIRVR